MNQKIAKKHLSLRPGSGSFMIGALAWLASTVLVSASVVTMTAVDASGTSSLSGAGKWDNAAAPSAINDYFSSVYYIRTPGTNVTFAGNSLTLQPPAAAGVSGQVSPVRSIIYKGTNTGIVTINTVTNAGGIINGGSGNVLGIFNGHAMYVISNSTIQADQGSFQLGWALYGSADLTNTSGQGRTITYTNKNSGFTGRFVINNSVTVAFTSPNGAPGNPAVSTPSQMDLGAGCTLLDNAGISLTNANGGITLEGNATINVASNTMTISEPITDNGNGYNLIKQGGGVLTLSGNNTFSGGLSLSGSTAGGQLNIDSATALGSGTFSILSNSVTLDNTSGAALILANNISQVWSTNFVFLGSASLNFGAGGVTLGANVAVAVSNNNLTVADVADNGAGFGLTKTGPGTLTLGDTSYSGLTLVSNGTLVAKSLASSTNITLATSTAVLNVTGGLAMAANQVLSGVGTISGGVTDNTGTYILPGGNSPGTLTVNGGLTLSGGATLDFNLGTSTTPGGGTNDLVVVTGTLNLAGPTTINVIGVPSTGTYTLVRYGSFAGSLANFLVPNGYTLANNTTAKTIELQATHVPVNLVWVGDGANNFWDTDLTFDWMSGTTASAFFAGDSVTFNDSGSTAPSISISGSVSPSLTTVNATGNYDFTGGGIVNGSLIKGNTGTLILENNNSYAGATVISCGTVQVGVGGTGGMLGTGVVTNNGTLVLNRSDAINLPSPIYGLGTVTMAGSGTLLASASNFYTGATLVNSGTIELVNADGLGSTNGGIIVNSGAGLYITGNVDVGAKPLTLNGSGASGAGALQKGGAGITTYYGPVTLTGETMLGVDTGATLNLTNSQGISGSSANANIILAGTGTGNISGPLALGLGNLTVNGGTWTVAPTNNFSSLTTINGGTLLLTAARSLGLPPAAFTTSAVTLNGGALGTSTNVTLADGKIGLSLTANSSVSVNGTNVTLNISNKISGDSSMILTKAGTGKLVLQGANDFGGTLDVDTSSTSASDGMTVIANSAAIANLPVVAGSPSINIRNNNGGSSTLALDGTAGNVTVAPDIGLSGRNVAIPAIENLAGNNTISGNVTLNVGGIYYIIQSDAGNLALTAAAWPYATPTSSTRSFTMQGAGNVSVAGVIQDGSNNGTSNIWVNLIKTGAGVLSLSAANTYSGTTIVSNGVLSLSGSIGSGGVTMVGGLLAGTGTIAGPVDVQAGASIEAGTTNTIGTLTVSGSPLTLAGNTVAKLNQNSGTSDLISGQSSVTYGGILTVTNLAGTLAAGNSFTLFSPGASTSNFSSIIGSPGAGLAYRFTNGVLSVVSGLVSYPTNLTVSVSGNTLSVSWPATHLGWILQTQTNALNAGLTTNWTDLLATASVTATNITINPANPTVFFRLRYPAVQ